MDTLPITLGIVSGIITIIIFLIKEIRMSKNKITANRIIQLIEARKVLNKTIDEEMDKIKGWEKLKLKIKLWRM